MATEAFVEAVRWGLTHGALMAKTGGRFGGDEFVDVCPDVRSVAVTAGIGIIATKPGDNLMLRD